MATAMLLLFGGALVYLVCEFYARLLRKGIGKSIKLIDRIRAGGHDNDY